MTRLIRLYEQSSIRHWLTLFLFINLPLSLLVSFYGGTNPASRFAMLVALVEDHSFQIDEYKDTTLDWAHPPDGHFYSNKAPGPVIVALPVFWLMDKLVTSQAESKEDRMKARYRWSTFTLSILSLITQAIPYAIIVALWVEWLAGMGASPAAQLFTGVALLFGNTASLFMNTFFGHGFAAMLVLWVLYLLVTRRFPFALGLTLGLSVLSDYGVVFLLPVIGWVLFEQLDKKQIKPLPLALGLLLPVLFWTYYHTACFGGPFSLPNKFQNPLFVEPNTDLFWGIFSLPKLEIVMELLFGFRRGILFTQPWVFVLLAIASNQFFKSKKLPEASLELTAVVVGGFFSVLLMNAGFNGWHGGSTAGPRYLSIILPGFGLLLGLYYDQMAVWAKGLTRLSLLVSLVLYIFVFVILNFPSEEQLWGHYVEALVWGIRPAVASRLLILIPAFFWAIWQSRRLAAEPNTTV